MKAIQYLPNYQDGENRRFYIRSPTVYKNNTYQQNHCFCTFCKPGDQEALSQLLAAKSYHLTAHPGARKVWLQSSPLRNILAITVGSRATLHPLELTRKISASWPLPPSCLSSSLLWVHIMGRNHITSRTLASRGSKNNIFNFCSVQLEGALEGSRKWCCMSQSTVSAVLPHHTPTAS